MRFFSGPLVLTRLLCFSCAYILETVLDNRGKKLESGDVAIYEAAKFTDAIIAGGVEVIQVSSLSYQ